MIGLFIKVRAETIMPCELEGKTHTHKSKQMNGGDLL